MAVGTTTLRTLESLYWLGLKDLPPTETELQLEQWEAYAMTDQGKGVSYRQSVLRIMGWMDRLHLPQVRCRTSLMVVPGYKFRAPTALVTNFHQPQSTLLLLIAAFVGKDWKRIYEHALHEGYRFLSYGDSSLLWKNDGDQD